MSIELWFGSRYPKAAVILFGIFIGVLISVWIYILYDYPLFFAILGSFLFYVLYGFLIYRFVFQKKRMR